MDLLSYTWVRSHWYPSVWKAPGKVGLVSGSFWTSRTMELFRDLMEMESQPERRRQDPGEGLMCPYRLQYQSLTMRESCFTLYGRTALRAVKVDCAPWGRLQRLTPPLEVDYAALSS
ncbi:unnamed protein product [Lota lota]